MRACILNNQRCFYNRHIFPIPPKKFSFQSNLTEETFAAWSRQASQAGEFQIGHTPIIRETLTIELDATLSIQLITNRMKAL